MVTKEIMRCPICNDLLKSYTILDNDSSKEVLKYKCSNCLAYFFPHEVLSEKAKPVVVDRLKEEELVKKTADLWNEYIKLDNIDDSESLEIASAIHTIQGRLAIRMHRRDVKESPFIK